MSASPVRFCSVLLKHKRGREKRVDELGLGLPAPLAGLMRKPIRREAAERGRREGRKEGGGRREGAIVFILMRRKARLHWGIFS